MPKIKNSSVEEVRDRVNIYDLVSLYVPLKKAGANYRGLSPFKAEKTPSFFVYPNKNFYYCFSTSQGGDIFNFVQTKENMNFADAVEFIAAKFNISLEYEQGGKSGDSPSLRKQIFDINEAACAWFSSKFLEESAEGEAVRKYWVEERKFSIEDAKKLRIGYAPVDWEEFKRSLEGKNYTLASIAASGLFFDKASNVKSLFQRFRGRLMIPICDAQGRVIAFTARKTRFTPTDIAYEEGKYVNSPETEIFKKKNVLFNFDKARSAAEDKKYFIVVEGQLDAIRMYCSGFENTVASQGTAAGLDHFLLMGRYSKKVVLLFDGDSAGRSAALKVIPFCFKAGMEPYVASLPSGEDPDTMILNKGEAAMKELVENGKIPAISFACRSILGDLPHPSPVEKRDALLQLFEIIANSPSNVLRDDYLREAATQLGLNLSSVKGDFNEWLGNRRTRLQENPETEGGEDQNQKESSEILTSAASDALLLCLHYEKLASVLSKVILDEWLDFPSTDAVALKKLLALYREGIGFSLEEIGHYFEKGEESNVIYKLSAQDPSKIDSPVKCANACAEKLFKNFMAKKIELANQMMAAETDISKKIGHLAQISKLRKEMASPPVKIVEQNA